MAKFALNTFIVSIVSHCSIKVPVLYFSIVLILLDILLQLMIKQTIESERRQGMLYNKGVTKVIWNEAGLSLKHTNSHTQPHTQPHTHTHTLTKQLDVRTGGKERSKNEEVCGWQNNSWMIECLWYGSRTLEDQEISLARSLWPLLLLLSMFLLLLLLSNPDVTL